MLGFVDLKSINPNVIEPSVIFVYHENSSTNTCRRARVQYILDYFNISAQIWFKSRFLFQLGTTYSNTFAKYLNNYFESFVGSTKGSQYLLMLGTLANKVMVINQGSSGSKCLGPIKRYDMLIYHPSKTHSLSSFPSVIFSYHGWLLSLTIA